MINKVQLPNYLLPQNLANTLVISSNPGGLILLTHRRRHSKPLPFPPGTNLLTPIEKPAQLNREYHSFLFDQWIKVKNAGGEPAWASAAGALTIKDNKGRVKNPTAYQLFAWYNSYMPLLAWSPNSVFNRGSASYQATPPDHTIPRPTPTSITLATTTPPNVTVQFQSTQDVSTYYVWLAINKATLPGCTPYSAYWRRLPVAPVSPVSPPPFIVYPWTCPPVPPMTATPNYTSAGWHCSGGNLFPNPTTPPQTIRAGQSVATFTLYVGLFLNTPLTNTATVSWGINPSTGARSCLWFPSGPTTFYLATIADWNAAPLIAYGPFSDPGWSSGYNDYTVQVTPTETIISGATGTPNHIATGPTPPSDVGLENRTSGHGVSYFQLYLPPSGYEFTTTYNSVLENPANHGPRNARLTLAPPGPPAPHSLWVDFPLTL